MPTKHASTRLHQQGRRPLVQDREDEKLDVMVPEGGKTLVRSGQRTQTSRANIGSPASPFPKASVAKFQPCLWGTKET